MNATDVDGLTALHHAVSEGHGDAALELLRAGAETDKRDGEGRLAIDMAPDSKVSDAPCRRGDVAANRTVGQEIPDSSCREGRYGFLKSSDIGIPICRRVHLAYDSHASLTSEMRR